MRGPGFLRRIGAYHDGALSGSARRRIERRVEADPEAGKRLHEMEVLGEAVRAAWTDGPPGPAPERVIASLRPQLRAIDQELARKAVPALGERLSALLRPAPARVLAGAALAVLLAVGVLPFVGTGETPSETSSISAASPAFGTSDTIYELDQAEVAVMVFEAEDGSTVVWMLEEEPDLISRGPFEVNA